MKTKKLNVTELQKIEGGSWDQAADYCKEKGYGKVLGSIRMLQIINVYFCEDGWVAIV